MKLQNLRIKSFRDNTTDGATAHKFKDAFGGDLNQATREVTKFFQLFPRLKAYLDYLANQALKNGYAKTFAPYARRRYFDIEHAHSNFKIKGEIERAGKNMPIQGTCADIVKLATFTLQERINNFNEYYGYKDNAKIVNQVHDEIVVEVPEENAEHMKELMRETMIECAARILKHCPVEVSATISKNWSK